VVFTHTHISISPHHSLAMTTPLYKQFVTLIQRTPLRVAVNKLASVPSERPDGELPHQSAVKVADEAEEMKAAAADRFPHLEEFRL
jgi:hypothetical protein